MENDYRREYHIYFGNFHVRTPYAPATPSNWRQSAAVIYDFIRSKWIRFVLHQSIRWFYFNKWCNADQVRWQRERKETPKFPTRRKNAKTIRIRQNKPFITSMDGIRRTLPKYQETVFSNCWPLLLSFIPVCVHRVCSVFTVLGCLRQIDNKRLNSSDHWPLRSIHFSQWPVPVLVIIRIQYLRPKSIALCVSHTLTSHHSNAQATNGIWLSCELFKACKLYRIFHSTDNLITWNGWIHSIE